jgi:2-oxoglutarate dehydrogenase E1 component
MIGGTHFQRYIPDSHPDALALPTDIRKHILCTGETLDTSFRVGRITPLLTGQVYHTLLHERQERGIKDVAISRLEQLSPFPYDLVCIHHFHAPFD